MPPKQEPVPAKTIEPVAPKAVEPTPARVIEPVAPKTIEPTPAKVIEPVAPKTIEPVPSVKNDNEEIAGSKGESIEKAEETTDSRPQAGAGNQPNDHEVKVSRGDCEAEDEDLLFNTSEGEAVKAAEVEPPKNETISALITAVVVHVVLAILLAFWVVSQPPPSPPQIRTRVPTTAQEDNSRQVKSKQFETAPDSTAMNRMDIAVSSTASGFSMPAFGEGNLSLEGNGLGDSFSPSMNFGGGGGGAVTFFGSKSEAQKVVFVVDVSSSMKAKGASRKSRFDLMKDELKGTVERLTPGVSFQIVFFSGASWFVGSQPDRGNWHEKGGRYWHYKDGRDEQLPRASLIPANRARILKTLRIIDEVKPTYGSDARSPLKMAMNLMPDVIFFMTDGEIMEDPEKKPLIVDLVEYNQRKSKAKINCIILTEIAAYEIMGPLAKETRGEVSLVQEDGTILRGRQVEDLAKKKR